MAEEKHWQEGMPTHENIIFSYFGGLSNTGITSALASMRIVHSIEKMEDEANRILAWLKREINEAWQKKNEIEPKREGVPKPKLLEILKLLPKTNCPECGKPTCRVFATRIAGG